MQLDAAEILRKTPIFTGMGDDDIQALAARTVERRYEAGEFVFWDGDAPEWLYIVAQGQIKVFKSSPSGREFIIAFFDAGEPFGEVAVFGEKPYPASAQAVSDTTVLAIRRDDFVSFLSQRPRVALRIINMLGERLRDAQNRLRDFAGARVEQRIANILLMLSARLGNTLPFTRQEIAEMSGTTTETAIRVMSQLRERKIIRSSRGRITIIDARKLRLLSEGPPAI